jgi:hypothetical protein
MDLYQSTELCTSFNSFLAWSLDLVNHWTWSLQHPHYFSVIFTGRGMGVLYIFLSNMGLEDYYEVAS